MSCWCAPSCELKMFKAWPGHMPDAMENRATKLRMEFKVFTGGSDSFAFHYDFSFPVTFSIAKI